MVAVNGYNGSSILPTAQNNYYPPLIHTIMSKYNNIGKPYKDGNRWALDYMHEGVKATVYALKKSQLMNPKTNPYLTKI